jgi:hypothetical protein
MLVTAIPSPKLAGDGAFVVELKVAKPQLGSHKSPGDVLALLQCLHAIKQEHPQATIELWAQDEHRIGLKPLIRRVWAKQGQRPIVAVNHRFQWLYVYGFVHPESGRLFLSLSPKVNAEIVLDKTRSAVYNGRYTVVPLSRSDLPPTSPRHHAKPQAREPCRPK